MSSRHQNHRRDRAIVGGRRWYRLPSDGMLAGICAGLADYYEISRLVVRILVITAGCFAPLIVMTGYIVGIFLLPTRRQLLAREEEEESIVEDIERRDRRRRDFDRELHGEPEGDDLTLDRKRILLRRFRERFGKLDRRLQDLERHVTSRRFDLGREIDGL